MGGFVQGNQIVRRVGPIIKEDAVNQLNWCKIGKWTGLIIGQAVLDLKN